MRLVKELRKVYDFWPSAGLGCVVSEALFHDQNFCVRIIFFLINFYLHMSPDYVI